MKSDIHDIFILGCQGDILHHTHPKFTTNESDLYKTFRITSFWSMEMIYHVRDEPIKVSRPPKMGHLIYKYPKYICIQITQANESICS